MFLFICVCILVELTKKVLKLAFQNPEARVVCAWLADELVSVVTREDDVLCLMTRCVQLDLVETVFQNFSHRLNQQFSLGCVGESAVQMQV